MKTPFRRTVALTLAAITLVTTSGCFGSFNATRKMWTFNRDASKDKFVRELLFLGMNVVPVYGIAAFVDVIGANAVEFWTGKNPIEMASRTRIDGKTSVESVVTEKDGLRAMEVKGFENDHLAWTTTMNAVRGTDLMEFKTVFATGRIVSRVIAVDRAGNPYLISNSDNSP
jgi:hypothetical protein